jgi:hypothetical protein
MMVDVCTAGLAGHWYELIDGFRLGPFPQVMYLLLPGSLLGVGVVSH